MLCPLKPVDQGVWSPPPIKPSQLKYGSLGLWNRLWVIVHESQFLTDIVGVTGTSYEIAGFADLIRLWAYIVNALDNLSRRLISMVILE